MGKLLGERGEQDAEHGRIALAWSTVQDLWTILLVVLLPAVAGEGQVRLEDVALAIGKAGLFLVLLVPFGLKVLPWIFERLALLRNREVFVLGVAAVALGTAYVSTLFGVSLALGAFAAGLTVGESDLSHQVLAEIAPLRDLLAGLFFVSIGMLVDPTYVATHVALILLVVAAMVVGKGVIVAGLTRAFGTTMRTAALVGVTLAQCGEFSFLLARVGRDAGSVTCRGLQSHPVRGGRQHRARAVAAERRRLGHSSRRTAARGNGHRARARSDRWRRPAGTRSFAATVTLGS